MGLYQPFPTLYRFPKQRNDYTISEIEKKYSNLELSRLILYNQIHNYSPKIYDPERLCTLCGKNTIPEKYQLSGVTECSECYILEKEKNFDYMLKIFPQENLEFEGNCIIENKLYLGNIRSSYLKDDLKKLGITHILMVGYYMTPIYPNDFIYENIEVDDNENENILQFLIKGINFIEQSKICYSHCQMGKSRSAAFVMAYIMYKNKIHFTKALSFIRKKRYIAFPNEGFQCQLEDFDIILNNFDYDLNKCDEFIKDYLGKRNSLMESEKDYLQKRFLEKQKEKFGNYSDSDDSNEDSDNNKDNDNIINEECDKKDVNKKDTAKDEDVKMENINNNEKNIKNGVKAEAGKDEDENMKSQDNNENKSEKKDVDNIEDFNNKSETKENEVKIEDNINNNKNDNN